MVSFPFCKINLGLHILSKREDGFHNIDTCLYPVGWTDILEILPADIFSFAISGIHVPGREDENICVKAFHALRKDFGIPNISMHLHKIIPIGAGLGGGSGDGAFALKSLNDIFNLQLTAANLERYASQLGSDCAFFIDGAAKIANGKGDQLTAISPDLKGKYIFIIMPDLHLSTATAYASITPRDDRENIIDILKRPIAQWREFLINDFEAGVIERNPIIGEIKTSLYNAGALYASMSGSGAAVFGIFESGQTTGNLFSGYRTFGQFT